MQWPIVCVFSFLTLAQAERNWSKIKTRDRPPPIGEEAIPHKFPYQVALFINKEAEIHDYWLYCGGSLISQRYVLTSADCLDGATQAKVVLGAHNLRKDERSQKKYISSKFTVHEGYDAHGQINNIGLIELPEDVPLNADIQLISLPSFADVDKSFAGEIATASGWAREIIDRNDVLRYVEVKVFPNSCCNCSYALLHDTDMCTSVIRKKKYCVGEPGGPLVIGTKQVGVATNVFWSCCHGNFEHSTFTRVTSFLDWIDANSDVAINKGIEEEFM